MLNSIVFYSNLFCSLESMRRGIEPFGKISDMFSCLLLLFFHSKADLCFQSAPVFDTCQLKPYLNYGNFQFFNPKYSPQSLRRNYFQQDGYKCDVPMSVRYWQTQMIKCTCHVNIQMLILSFHPQLFDSKTPLSYEHVVQD